MRVRFVYERRRYATMLKMRHGLATLNSNNSVVYGQKHKDLVWVLVFLVRTSGTFWDQNWADFVKFSVMQKNRIIYAQRGRVAQSVTCLATDASLTADPGVASSITARSHTFVEIDHEIISTVILLLSRRVVVSYKRKYVHEVLVNCLFKLAQEKVWLDELTVPQWP